jgi:hypothetical protein
MPHKFEFDFSMRPLNLATGAAFALTLVGLSWLGLMLSATAGAQVNGMPASVTSPGFGGRQVNGVAPSVTSLGPRGFGPGSPTCCFTGTSLGRPHFVATPNPTLNLHHHHHGSLPWGSAVYAVPYYGYYDSGADTADSAPDEQYNGGPTIWDRRGPGTAPAPVPDTYSRGARNDSSPAEPASDGEVALPEATPASDQPQTVLVFKDGHQVEVANYAIVGSTLYDLTGGRRQRIALADLDLTATAKQNDDRGIDFELPAASEAN